MSPPLIRDATLIRLYRLGPYLAGLFGDIESAGEVEYLYILMVGEEEAPGPRLSITSEVNKMAHIFGGSHFLCMFDDRSHTNMGSSDEWADLEHFTREALSIAAERLGVADTPEQLPL